jgi:hypothetical protein
MINTRVSVFIQNNILLRLGVHIIYLVVGIHHTLVLFVIFFHLIFSILQMYCLYVSAFCALLANRFDCNFSSLIAYCFSSGWI